MKLKNMDFCKGSKITLIYRGKTKTYYGSEIPANEDWLEKNVVGVESEDSRKWITMELGD